VLAKPLAVTSAHRYCTHILIVRIPLGKLYVFTVEPQSREVGPKVHGWTRMESSRAVQQCAGNGCV